MKYEQKICCIDLLDWTLVLKSVALSYHACKTKPHGVQKIHSIQWSLQNAVAA
jgi:hypothetical protein